MFDVQQHSSPPFPPASQISTPYFKVKQEENIDYENCEGIHICPNVIAEARMLETQARSSFSKSCSHEPPVCSHNPETPSGTVTYNSPGCGDTHPGSQGHLSSNSPTSCFYDSCATSSSCAVDSSSFQGSVLAHLPFSGSQQPTAESYQRQKEYHSWPNQNQYYRSNSYTSTEQKSSCMMRENYDNINSPLHNLQSSSTPSERSYRTSLSHMPYPSENPIINLRSHTPTGSQPTPHQQYLQSLSVSSQPQSYTHPSFNTSPDVKPYSYQMHQQNVRQTMSPPRITPPINYSQSQSPIHPPPPTPQLTPGNMNHHLHNHPAGMPSSFCSPYEQAGNMGLATNPGGVPVNPIMNPELQAQSLTEYQYQQQQMFYARDNRRPRRIACTCPNCRDGENKTVTTKDGKQRKLHVCHIPGCGKIYGKTSHLRAHLRWHAGERPFACNWLFCNKRFTRSDELQRHRRTHTGDKRFECSICLKKFMRSDHLSKHMKTHQSHNKQTTKDKTDTAAGADKTKQTAAAVQAAAKLKTTDEEAPKSAATMGISESMKL